MIVKTVPDVIALTGLHRPSLENQANPVNRTSAQKDIVVENKRQKIKTQIEGGLFFFNNRFQEKKCQREQEMMGVFIQFVLLVAACGIGTQ